MKKLISILLLFQFLTNNTFAEEFIKLPKLFTHFYHHSQEHQDTDGFVQYLIEHYSDHHENDEHQGEDKDCNLPFKHCDGCCINIHIPLLAFLPVFEKVEFIFTIDSSQKYIFRNEKIKNICAHSIWQPPKIS